MRKRLLLFLSVMACLGIAACGGSSGSSSTGGSSSTAPAGTTAQKGPTYGTFVAQLNSVCKRANAAYLAAKKPAGQVAAIQHYLGVFHGVKPPPLLQPEYSKYLTVLAKELAALKQGNGAKLVKIRNTQAGPLVKRLGATGCYG